MARASEERLRCTAQSKTSGERCKQPVIPGGTVCRYHGGSAPQVQRKARMRLAALVDPAIEVLAEVMADKESKTGDRIRASENVLDRTGYGRSSTLDVDDARDLLRERLAKLREARAETFDDEEQE